MDRWRESTGRRAWKDAKTFRASLWFAFLWDTLGALVVGALGGWWGVTRIPHAPTADQSYWYPTVGAASGIVLGFAIVFPVIYLWNLFRAPYRQRNEARAALKQAAEEQIADEVVQLAGQPVALTRLFYEFRDQFLRGRMGEPTVLPSIMDRFPGTPVPEASAVDTKLFVWLHLHDLIQEQPRMSGVKGYTVTIATDSGAKLLRHLEKKYQKDSSHA